MARRGRPRLDRPALDRGTEELQARRARLAGVADPALASYPLGVLLANGDIDDAGHQAGCRYAWLYRFRFGRTGPAARAWAGAPRGAPREWPPEIAAAIEADQRAVAALFSARPAEKRAVEEIVVFGREPRWMRPVAPTPRDVLEALAFHDGLARLVRHFRAGGRASRRAAHDST